MINKISVRLVNKVFLTLDIQTVIDDSAVKSQIQVCNLTRYRE